MFNRRILCLFPLHLTLRTGPAAHATAAKMEAAKAWKSAETACWPFFFIAAFAAEEHGKRIGPILGESNFETNSVAH